MTETEFFEDEESSDNEDVVDAQPIELEEVVPDNYRVSSSEARRRLERLLAEKKLQDELEDFY